MVHAVLIKTFFKRTICLVVSQNKLNNYPFEQKLTLEAMVHHQMWTKWSISIIDLPSICQQSLIWIDHIFSYPNFKIWSQLEPMTIKGYVKKVIMSQPKKNTYNQTKINIRILGAITTNDIQCACMKLRIFCGWSKKHHSFHVWKYIA